MAQKGCTVLLGARNAELGQAAAKDLQADGEVQFLELDVTSDGSVDKAAAFVKQQFGHLDIRVRRSCILALLAAEADTESLCIAACMLADESKTSAFMLSKVSFVYAIVFWTHAAMMRSYIMLHNMACSC